MASIINFSNLTFTAEQIRNINELVFEKTLKAPDVAAMYAVYGDIVADKEVGFITGGSDVGLPDTGCGQEAQSFQIGVRKVTWQPKPYKVFVSECYSDLQQTAAVYSMRRGTPIADLTDTDYIAIVTSVLIDKVREFIFRVVWFGDTTAANESAGGDITNGKNAALFQLFDGFYKQAEVQATANTSQLVAIPANSQASYAAQRSGMDANAAYSLLSAMYFAAPVELRAMGELRFYVTQSIADAYQQYLIGTGIEATYTNLVEGVQALTFLGVPVIPMPLADVIIRTYFDDGAAYVKPHRALLTAREVLGVGADTVDAFNEVKVWYSDDTEKTSLRVRGKLDAKILAPTHFVLGI